MIPKKISFLYYSRLLITSQNIICLLYTILTWAFPSIPVVYISISFVQTQSVSKTNDYLVLLLLMFLKYSLVHMNFYLVYDVQRVIKTGLIRYSKFSAIYFVFLLAHREELFQIIKKSVANILGQWVNHALKCSQACSFRAFPDWHIVYLYGWKWPVDLHFHLVVEVFDASSLSNSMFIFWHSSVLIIQT